MFGWYGREERDGKWTVSLGNSSQGWANFPIRNSFYVHLPRKTEQQQQQLFWLLHRLRAMFPELKSHQRSTTKYTEDRNLVKMRWGWGRVTRKADCKLKGRGEKRTLCKPQIKARSVNRNSMEKGPGTWEVKAEP